jgi:hypothetical protein
VGDVFVEHGGFLVAEGGFVGFEDYRDESALTLEHPDNPIIPQILVQTNLLGRRISKLIDPIRFKYHRENCFILNVGSYNATIFGSMVADVLDIKDLEKAISTEFEPTVTVAKWCEGQTYLAVLSGEHEHYWLQGYTLGKLYRSGELEEMA